MSDKLLFVVTEDWYFVSHRLQLAKTALAQGYDVVIATRVGRHGDVIRDAGIRLIPFELARRGGNPFLEIWSLFRLYRREQPRLIHHVAMKPIFFGAIAAKLAGDVGQVNAIAGLGWLFTSSSRLARLIRPIVSSTMVHLLNSRHSLTIVQNTEDGEVLKRMGLAADRIRLIPGVGVDINVFCPATNPSHPPCVMLAARMLWTKGVGEFVAAARLLAMRGVKARFLLVGEPDPTDPDSIPEAKLREWHGQFGVEWFGRREDMPSVWQSAHIACLPSHYREGLPKCLLEAAACGLPIVTTDTPGCREVIVDGKEGLLVPPKNAETLAEAIERLLCQPELRKQMGEKARERAIRLFSDEQVIAATLSVYAQVLR
jgi:glycosyltransferase involved in cell wall biosynthesis